MGRFTANQALVFAAVFCIALLLAPFDHSFFEKISLEYPQPKDSGPVIGIDLGLKYSRVGIVENGTFVMILDENNRGIVPSVIAFTADGKHLVGFEAQEQAPNNSKNMIYEMRHLVGANMSDPTTRRMISNLRYDVVEMAQNDGILEVKVRTDEGEQFFSPEDLTAMIFKKLRTMAEAHLNDTVTSAVLAVPPHFTDAQRKSTSKAAKIAGLNVLRMPDEPEAAALGHHLHFWEDCGEYDFYVNEQCNIVVYDIQETGSDLSILEIDHGLFEVKASIHRDRTPDSFRYLPTIIQNSMNYLGTGSSSALIGSVERLLKDASLSKQEIRGILVTGDQNLISKAEKFLEGYFGTLKAITSLDFSNDEAVVRGAALLGDALRPRHVEWDGCRMTLDVLQLSIGVEASNGTFHTIVPNDIVIPTRRTRIISTAFDNQDKVVINMWEGQRSIATRNRLLGTLQLKGIAPRPRGVPKIELSLEVDVNRVFSATARELQSDNENRGQLIVRARKSSYTEDTIRAIFEDAETFREEDARWIKGLSDFGSDKYKDGGKNFGILVR